MQEIEVGEYVRTTNGEIGKARVIIQDMIFINTNQYYYLESDIKKRSKNIKELIEDGDYLNGYLVRKINGELCNFDLNEERWIQIKNIDIIESLVTHEQFEEIEYKI